MARRIQQDETIGLELSVVLDSDSGAQLGILTIKDLRLCGPN